jgi:growth factor-regulated tyrosine kinase substrate
MHDKLSQIVKLYDKALTEHVSHHSWRTVSPQQASVAVPYQPQHQATLGAYGNADGWTPETPHVAMAPPPLPINSPPAEPSYQGTGQTYFQRPADQQQQKLQWLPQQQAVQPPQFPLPQHQQLLKQSPSDPRVVQQQQSVLTTATPVPPTPVPVPPPPSQVQYAQSQISPSAPSSHVSPTPSQYAAPQMLLHNSAPANKQQTQRLTPSQYTQPQMSPPISSYQQIQPQSTPRSTFQVSVPQPGTGKPLSRHSTISVPSTSTNHGFLARQSTVSHPNYQQRHQRQQQQQQPPIQQPILPNFPVAPSSAPQAFNMYAQNIPNGVGVEQEERKEALLIDL